MASKQPKKPTPKKPAPLSSKTAAPTADKVLYEAASTGKHIKKVVIEL
jgi:hypothetical protein